MMENEAEQLPPQWKEAGYRGISFDKSEADFTRPSKNWDKCETVPKRANRLWRTEPGWERSLKEMVDNARIEKLEKEIGKLSSLVEELKDQLETKAPQPIVSPIATLAPEPFDLVRPINALITPCEDGFVASFLDANISSSGETRYEAVDNLKDLILMVFQGFETEGDGSLGPAMLKQKMVLFDVIRRKQ